MDLTMHDVMAAEHRIKPFVKTTPIMNSKSIDQICGYHRNIFFKCENLQETGTVKVRGALNAVSNILLLVYFGGTGLRVKSDMHIASSTDPTSRTIPNPHSISLLF